MLEIALIIIGSVILCCLVLFGLAVRYGPDYGPCLDFVSGRAPRPAIARYIDRVIQATRNEEWEWLSTVTVGYRREEAIEELKNVRALMAGEYTLRPWDDLGGWYDYSVKFENGAELGLKVYAAWPECPDWDVTEDEIFSLIKLDRIYEIPLPTATVSP